MHYVSSGNAGVGTMPDMLHLLGCAILLAFIAWLLCKVVFQTYYNEREKFWDRIVAKLKGDKNGKA